MQLVTTHVEKFQMLEHIHLPFIDPKSDRSDRKSQKNGFSAKNWRRIRKVWSLHCLHCPVELAWSFHQNYGQLLLKYCINIVSIFCKIPLSISIFSKLFSKIFLVIYRYFVTKNSIYSVNYTYIMQLSLKIGLLFKVAFIAYT